MQVLERSLDVALVGRRLEDNDNLGLAYLQAALDAEGVRNGRFVLNEAADLDAVARAIVRAGPRVVGLSLPDGGSAPFLISLAGLLRMRGFRGHVTCGGSFATLARAWLLERNPAIDSVVRYAGERPLVELWRAVAAGAEASGVAGVTTRAGDGEPATVLDPMPMRLRPRRDELTTILGHRAAHLAATRGCEGRCTYCGPAALQHEERREGLRAGLRAQQLDDTGVGRVRRREVLALCDEMAELWHTRDVRYFYFVDEHLLPYDEAGALEYLHELRAGLVSRRVGPLGIGAMLRADRITAAIVKAFRAAGLARLFLGIEFGTSHEARIFGRKTNPRDALELLDVAEREGIAVVSNLMLVHPESTVETVRAGIGFLSDVRSGVFETTRMMVYHGTRLWERMRAAGRLTGNPFRYGYSFGEPAMARFAEIFTRLRAEAFWDHSIAYRTHDAHLALALAKRLHGAADVRDLESELEGVRRSVNELYVTTYEAALTLAEHGKGAYEATGLLASASEKSATLAARLERCADRIASRAGTPSRVFSPMRAAAAGTLAFVMAGASAVACGGKTTVDALGGGGAAQDGGQLDSSADASEESPVLVTCTPDEAQREREQMVDTVLASDPCFSGAIAFQGDSPSVSFSLPYQGMGVRICSLPANDAKTAAAEAVAKAALAGQDFPCLPASSFEYIEVPGAAASESTKMGQLLADACPQLFNGYQQVAIVIDDSGHVTGVIDPYNDGGTLPQDVVQCIMATLAGLTFPCLGGYLICPEYVIAE